VLALALRQNNIPVRIIEKDAVWHKGQRGTGLQPRSLELFHFLGTLPEIKQEGIEPVQVVAYKMPEGKEVAKRGDMVEVAESTPDVPFVSGFQLLRMKYMDY
jgi:2-polyprenyl-6-methoxyphenol hydroxylase-like FAD-dependent oxidoreductase